MWRLVSAALHLTAASALRTQGPYNTDAVIAVELNASETQAAAPEPGSKAAGAGAGRDRGACLAMYKNLCDPQSGNRAVLVTGSGGTGTHSLSAMFQMNGLDLGHEDVGKGGSVSWPYAVDVTHTAFAGHDCLGNSSMDWLRPPRPSGTHFRSVYHVVRCPVDTIAALTTHNECSMKYLESTLQMGYPHELVRGDLRFWAQAWLAQNEFVESYAQRTFTLDNFAELFREVCRDSGLHEAECLSATLPVSNHRTHEARTWADLSAAVGAELTGAIRRAAVRYGFGEDCLEDAARAKREPFPRAGEVVTHGIPGAECSGEPGQDCTDGLDWVWEASAVERIKRSGGASFRSAWAAV